MTSAIKLIQTSGSRKSAKARATLTEGTGVITINSFALATMSDMLMKERTLEPLRIAQEVAKTVNIEVRTHGGGSASQAEAARVAIARALAQHDKKLAKIFIDYDRTLLVTDVRLKETHKPNRHGKARAKVQKSYR